MPLWVVDNSIFAPRKGESDAKAFYDTPKVRQRMFAKDWAYLTGLPRFPKFAARLGGAKRGKEAPPAGHVQCSKDGRVDGSLAGKGCLLPGISATCPEPRR